MVRNPAYPASAEFGDRVGEGPADLALVLVLDGDAQVRGGQLVGGGVRAVEAQQPTSTSSNRSVPPSRSNSRRVACSALSSTSRPVMTMVIVLR